ncbi:ABC transporter substrate-binding protein, partial [Pseudomonas sp. RA_15y_Pfl1_P12]|uniref:ABC transporter substrate-binding protein n=1 Tax=Pseudomonas sp. RA_15y_Pfl1_P12 TaxID=3088703 RepID=UPI0030DCDD45
ATGPSASTIKFYTSDVPKYPYDPAKAKALLKEAGYKGEKIRMLPLAYGETWQRWGEAVKQNLQDVGMTIETIATGIRWAEGPVWVPRGDYLLFSDPPANVIRRWSRATGTEVFLSPSDAVAPDPATVREGGSNGLTLDHAGNLLIAG